MSLFSVETLILLTVIGVPFMFTRVRNIATNTVSSLVDKVELAANPEVLGVNALAAAFSVLVMGDKVVEVQEKEDVSEYLIDLPIIAEKGLMREAAEAFLTETSFLEEGFAISTVEGNIRIGEVLTHIAKVKDDTEWCGIIAATVKLMTSGDEADDGEIKARNRILAALGK